MKLIPLTKGKFAQVDDADYDDLAQFKWYFDGRYARRSTPRQPGQKRQGVERMHRRILGLPPGNTPFVDHRDLDKLNNQRHNLRSATRSQNVQNSGLRADNKSGFKGVTWRPDNGNWQAQLNVNGRNRHLGYFPQPELAYEFRCLAADMCHGEFARAA